MKIQSRQKYLICILLFNSLQITAQPLYSDTSLLISAKFELGETKTYHVVEENKMYIPLFSLTGKHTFRIHFTILDTTNGYTILYKVQTIETTNKRFLMESIKAKITDGLSLTYKLNKQGWLIDLPDYNKCQVRAIRRLDSILFNNQFSQNDLFCINALKRNLAKPDGLEILLTPLLLFNDIFTKPVFTNHKKYHPARLNNIFYEPNISGTMILEMSKLDVWARSANVSVDFIANQDSAGKYIAPVYQEIYLELKGKKANYVPGGMKLNFEREYAISLPNGYPLLIRTKQIVIYIERFVSRTTMEIVK